MPPALVAWSFSFYLTSCEHLPPSHFADPDLLVILSLTKAGKGIAMPAEVCVHIDTITDIKQPKRRVCEECIKTGAQWTHLRTCQTCDATLCCDSSPNQHASKHARSSSHPVIASAERGERWLYCYPDDAFAEY